MFAEGMRKTVTNFYYYYLYSKCFMIGHFELGN